MLMKVASLLQLEKPIVTLMIEDNLFFTPPPPQWNILGSE